MAFRFREARQSRASAHSPASETRIYTASGSNDGSFVRTYTLAATPSILSHERGTLYRQDVRVDPVGYQQWRLTVPYAPRKREHGQIQIDFDTTGGTVHITNSKETIERYAPAGKSKPEDMGGAINVQGDNVEGVDTVIPALKMNVALKHPAGVITIAQMKNLARWTGTVNSTPFLTFEPGEVLFLGASGSEGTESETELRYQFAMSQNQDDLTFGDIVNVVKKGFHYAWIRYEEATKNAEGDPRPVRIPRDCYVERVYEEIDLATALGFGG